MQKAKVVNTQPFKLVYSIVENPHFGWLIEPHVVQINTLGHYTLTHQKLYTKTSGYFSKNIDEQDLEIMKVLDAFETETMVRRFYTKSKIRPSEFFKKYLTTELLETEIRPYIDEHLDKAIRMLKGKPLFKMSKDDNPTFKEVKLSIDDATVLFHFRRNEAGTRYFATIKHEGERIDFMKQESHIICNDPAWMLTNNLLINFKKHIEGKKLQPFITKRFIQIPPASEETYFEKFVVPLIEKYDVYAEGFEIRAERHRANPVLSLKKLPNGYLCMVLSFNYDDNVFDYDAEKEVSASMVKEENNYVFKRIKRAADWEEGKRQFIEELGLQYLGAAAFCIDKEMDDMERHNYLMVDWLSMHNEELTKHNFIIEQHDSVETYYYLGNKELELEVKEHSDWFDVKATVKFGEFSIPFIQLKNHILNGHRQFKLPNGEIAIIPEEWMAKFAGLIEFSKNKDGLMFQKFHWNLLNSLQNDDDKLATYKTRLGDLKKLEEIEEVELPVNFKGKLRSYQKAGYDWLNFLKQNKFGGCLADDMGLGKTIQTLALLQNEKELAEREPVTETAVLTPKPAKVQLSIFDVEEETTTTQKKNSRTSLIILPNSLIYNWISEAKKFTPDIKVFEYTGSNREKCVEHFHEYDLIITTYGTARNDIEVIQKFHFHYVILDESQIIKNPSSQTARAIRNLNCTHKLALTGTPVENTIVDLWSQMNFLNNGLLGNYHFFNEKFVQPIEKYKNQEKAGELQKLISPFVLRRTKEQVAKDLPKKMEQVHYCEMTEEQEKMYERIKSHYRNEILESIDAMGLRKSQMQIIKGLTELRLIANHPIMVDEEFLGESGKFNEITRMAETAMQENHKLLMFSQFVKQLTLFKNYFDAKGIRYCYIDGSMSAKKRKEQVDIFQSDESIQLFLISLKAGGVGLNLTAADYVFLIDPWWNPAVERQAQDRTHRIGQTKKVFTYKFITQNTVEEKILDLQRKKTLISDSIIKIEESFVKKLQVADIENLLQ